MFFCYLNFFLFVRATPFLFYVTFLAIITRIVKSVCSETKRHSSSTEDRIIWDCGHLQQRSNYHKPSEVTKEGKLDSFVRYRERKSSFSSQDSSSAESVISLNMNPTDKSTAKQNELIATLIEQFQSLTYEFKSFRNSTDQNIKNIKEFTETSDRDRSKEIRDLANIMEIKYDTETDQSQMSTYVEI